MSSSSSPLPPRGQDQGQAVPAFRRDSEEHRPPRKGKKPKRPLGAEPTTQFDPRDLSAVLAYGPSFLPYTAAWTDSRIEQVHAFRRWVFVAVNKICETVARKHPNVSYLSSSDPEDYQVKSGDRDFLSWSHARAFPSLDRGYLRSISRATQIRHLEARKRYQRALTPLLSHESLQPLEHNHPLKRLLADPNDPDTSWSLWYETVMFFLLTGNAYWWMPMNEAGLPLAIWVVPSHWMWPVVGKTRLIEGWEIRPVEGNYLRQVLPAEEVIHFRHPNPISKVDGMAPLTAVAQWADVSESIDRSRVFAFRNGLTPTMAVQFDGTLNDPSDEMLRRIDAKIISRYVGENRSNKPLYLPPGVKVLPISLKPNEMVWGASAEETRNNILAGFNVPPGIVALAPTGPGDQVTYCNEAVNPLVSFLGQVVSEKLCPLYDPARGIRLWWEDFVPDDPSHLEETIKTDLMCGAITPNEVRILRGRQPIPEDWADRPVLPVNMAPLTLPGGGPHQDPDTVPGTNLPDMPRTSDEPKHLGVRALPGSITSLMNGRSLSNGSSRH